MIRSGSFFQPRDSQKRVGGPAFSQEQSEAYLIHRDTIATQGCP